MYRLLLLFATLAGLMPAAAAGTFDYQALETLIKEHKVTTIEALLPLIPEQYRQHYTLIYNSRSAQRRNVFPEWPRVVFYGDDATFIMAFTKNPLTAPVVNQPDTIETIQYDTSKRAFAMRELVFKEGMDPLATPPEVNPPSCLDCHGADPRPNWDGYNLWTGAFGSVSRVGCDTMQPGTKELSYYQEFMAKHRNQGRYQFLPTEIPGQSCPLDPTQEVTFRNGAATDPNAQLSQMLFKLNKQRLRRIIMTAPAYPKYKYLITALAQGCTGGTRIENYFPQGFAETHHFRTPIEAYQHMLAGSRNEFAMQLAEFNAHNRPSDIEPGRKPINFNDVESDGAQGFLHGHTMGILTLLAERMGLDMRRWSTNIARGSYNFTTPSSFPDEIYRQWIDTSDPTTDRELAAMSCETLQRLSVKAFE